jgi:3-hydroxyisobutyrate dehydrogenase-like beta-hydroxyacid dehydrogenase
MADQGHRDPTAGPRIGFAGLGAMGAGIVRRLLDAGYEVVGWNRTRARAEPLIDAGMGWADTPRQLAGATDVLFTMLTDTAAVQATAEGPDGVLAGLSDGSIWADLSTISPDASVALAERARASGARFLDTPVSGSMATLAEGQMSVMVGGDRDAYERIEPILRAIGPKVTHIGANGQALLTKVSINLALVVQVVAFCEGVALAEKAGVRRDAVVDAMLKSVIASPVIGYRAPLILEENRDHEPYADVDLQQKDLVLALELARRLGASLPTTAVVNELLNASRGNRLADRDFVLVHEIYRRLAGLA